MRAKCFKLDGLDGLVTDPAVVDSMGSATVTTSLFINNGDTTAPSPNPMTLVKFLPQLVIVQLQ